MDGVSLRRSAVVALALARPSMRLRLTEAPEADASLLACGAERHDARHHLPAIFAGVLAAIVGFASSFAIVVQGLLAAGATPAQAASGLMALSLAMGLCGVLLSLTTRMPVSIAWSTPAQHC